MCYLKYTNKKNNLFYKYRYFSFFQKGNIFRMHMILNACGIDSVGLLLISDYLSRPKLKTKKGSSYSSWHDISGGPQSSLLRLLLFNIFINDLFLFIWKSEVCNFPDNNTQYSVGKNIENCISNLKTDLVGGWFKINSLKANPSKFQLMNLGNRDKRSFDIRINNVQIKKLNELTLLGKNC